MSRQAGTAPLQLTTWAPREDPKLEQAVGRQFGVTAPSKPVVARRLASLRRQEVGREVQRRASGITGYDIQTAVIYPVRMALRCGGTSLWISLDLADVAISSHV